MNWMEIVTTVAVVLIVIMGGIACCANNPTKPAKLSQLEQLVEQSRSYNINR